MDTGGKWGGKMRWILELLKEEGVEGGLGWRRLWGMWKKEITGREKGELDWKKRVWLKKNTLTR
ncbi:hypothetical protein, partial [Siminovitchia fortis]|uniref:hypothetical protein n=1 Tax=Siminovitchia fortis TaxID=254758 RepID=UPI0011A04D77